MKYFFFLLFIVAQVVACSFALCQPVASKSENTIVVRINGIKTQNGQVLLSLFKSPEGFPIHPEKAFKWGRAKVTASSIIISFNGLPPGTYAIAAVHDENSNEVMDTDWLGLPDEDYGVSNNVSSTLSPPKFEEAKFNFTGKRDTVMIEMKP